MITPAKVAVVAAATVFATLDEAWKFLQGGVIGAAAFIGACATLWIWVLRPFVRRCSTIVHQAGAAHAVILGDPEKNVPSLSDRLDHQDERLASGDADFARIEGKVDEVKDRIEKVEGVIDVIGASERQDIRTVLSAARIHPRRSTDPPLPPTPLRREEG